MSSDDGPPDVPIVCAECGTRTRVPLPEAVGAVARHNDGFHDGDAVAEVDPALTERLADLVAEELDLYGD